MIPEITIDARQAVARFSRAGIPEHVRTRLRQLLPGVTRRLGQRVEARLDSGLKSRSRLTVKQEMVENRERITGRVRVVWTGDPKKKMVPQWLESGTRPHEIRASGLGGGAGPKALYFYWARIGTYFLGPRVMHPGFPGIRYMETALEQMGPDIVQAIKAATIDGARQR